MIALEKLKERLINNRLVVQNEKGSVEEVGFLWNAPVSEDLLIQFEKDYGFDLPEHYKKFLKITNGAVLFKDIQYGQWGCKIHSLEEVIAKTSEAKEYGKELKDYHIVFAEWLGDGDILVFDLDKQSVESNRYILDGDECYGVDEWVYINGNFEQWLDRLIVAQGAKYWRWC